MKYCTPRKEKSMSRLALSLAAAALALSSFAGFAAPPAQASSMPKADFGSRNVFGLGLGNGVSLGLDFPVSRELSLGLSANFGYFKYSPWNSAVDFRLLYKLLGGGRGLTLDLLGGVGTYGPGWFTFGAVDPFLGVALAYPLTPRLNLRGNLAIGLLYRSYYGPSGIELGYEFSNNVEGTIGVNGHGDVLGLKVSF
jgi:hypothetical protein